MNGLLRLNVALNTTSKYPVFAMLTGLHDFYILQVRYEGSISSLSSYQTEITAPKCPRSAFFQFKLHGMINGSVAIFIQDCCY